MKPQVNNTSRDRSFSLGLDDLRDLLSMHWRIATLVFALSVGMGIAYNLIATPTYQGKAVVLVSVNAGQELSSKRLTEVRGQYHSADNRMRFLLTQLDLIVSRPNLTTALEKYKAAGYSDPEMEAGGPDLLRSSVTVKLRGDTELIEISALHTDPARAATLANLVAQSYREANLNTSRDAAREARIWLEEQIKQYEQRIDQIQQGLVEYQTENNIADAAEAITVLSAQMQSLKSALGEVNTQRVLLDSRLQSHLNMLAAKQYQALAPDLNTESLSALSSAYSELVIEHTRISARYGEKHPENQRITIELQQLESKLVREITRGIDNERTSVAALKKDEARLQTAIDAAHEKLLGRQDTRAGYEQLRTDLETSRAFYQSLNQRRDELALQAQTQLSNVHTIEPAHAPTGAYAPSLKYNLAVSIILGFIFALAASLIRQFFNDRITSPLDISTRLGLPYLGFVPRIEKVEPGRHLAFYTHDHPHSIAAESVRAIRTIIDTFPDRKIKRLLVTSAISEEGKTSTTVRLAIAFAGLNKRVLVIDCDLRRPCIHKVFADNKDNGLVDIFRGGSFDQMVRKTEDPALHYLTTGTNPYQCTELLASLKMTHLLSQLDSQYDLILIDSPPTTVTADAAILSQLVDGTILIARENAVPLSLLKTAVDGLEKVGADLLGVIVNCMDLNRQRYSLRYGYGYNYRYSYSYEYGKEDRERAKEAAN